jgi:hypothetical protein
MSCQFLRLSRFQLRGQSVVRYVQQCAPNRAGNMLSWTNGELPQFHPGTAVLARTLADLSDDSRLT